MKGGRDHDVGDDGTGYRDGEDDGDILMMVMGKSYRNGDRDGRYKSGMFGVVVLNFGGVEVIHDKEMKRH